MKPSEKVALGLALEELERPKARARELAGRAPSGNVTEGQKGETLAIVGQAVGMSRPTYGQVRYLPLP